MSDSNNTIIVDSDNTIVVDSDNNITNYNDSNNDDNDDNDNNDDNDSNDDDNDNTITLAEGLSPETLALLLEFLPNGRFENNNDNDDRIEDSNVCVAYTDNDINVITETVNRLTKKNEEEMIKKKIAADSRVLLPLINTINDDDIYNTLINDGVVRVNNILNDDHCDILLEWINSKLAIELELNNPQTCQTGFGNVLCREHRWDMYLHDDNVCHDALQSILGDANDTLIKLFSKLFDGCDAEFHELSSLISDHGANSQPIHPDSVFTKISPLFTIFIALQDIDNLMGPTIFLPRTNNLESHNLHKNSQTKDDFLAKCEYRQSCLKKG
jgi:hypothetical protein